MSRHLFPWEGVHSSLHPCKVRRSSPLWRGQSMPALCFAEQTHIPYFASCIARLFWESGPLTFMHVYVCSTTRILLHCVLTLKFQSVYTFVLEVHDSLFKVSLYSRFWFIPWDASWVPDSLLKTLITPRGLESFLEVPSPLRSSLPPQRCSWLRSPFSPRGSSHPQKLTRSLRHHCLRDPVPSSRCFLRFWFPP